ncbi:MAG: NAD(P)/FAD-dependent oxidoreductase [Ardenticatenaceae bacterium]|nr:NAD(P)/FAD-dependent oxidoreductase [Anaerolineales bacterium]MCB8939649.1 NAD(P)/FAD-dependent oxidoreductase [Ardenticatenaceae bacterium]MCB8974926.1 NAD(P)/FAD-dependent oxidoreductase [Ardenticatenaceae bacterium]
MSMTDRDVIVVGAGPAGATAAAALAQKGYDVLLMDRHEFPRDKTCGDAVPAGAIELLWRLGMQDKIAQSVARGELYPVEGMLLVSPRGHELHAKFSHGVQGSDSYVAPRIYFDALIQEHAVASGAEFCVGQAKAPIVENGKVVGVTVQGNGRTQNIRARLVIGADGVTSAIARNLRPKTEQHNDSHRAVALRAYIEDIEELPGEVEFYLYKEILPGYAWIFPTGNNRANIGLGMRLDHFRKKKYSLENMLQDFLKMPAIKKRLLRGGQLRDIATWQLNFGSQKNLQHVFDGAILVGDAAGFINPLTGGGIHNSLVSADLAAQVADEALKANDISRARMQVYERLCHEHMWESMRNSFWMQRTFMHFPFLVDFLVRRMKENSQLAQTFLTKL